MQEITAFVLNNLTFVYMSYRKSLVTILFFGFSVFVFISCHDNRKPPEKDVVTKPEKLQERESDDLKKLLEYAEREHGGMIDSSTLHYIRQDSIFYSARNFEPLWSGHGEWLPLGDSLFSFIKDATAYGLFPQDYHFRALSFIRRALTDSFARRNAMLWTRADILYTDAFFTLLKDLKRGRLDFDSVTLRKDSVLSDTFFTANLDTVLQSGSISATLEAREPGYRGYDSLKRALHKFLATAKFNKPFTYLYYPYADSVEFFHALQKRFFESGIVASDSTAMDITALAGAIKKYQREKGLKATGQVTEALVNMLDNTDLEKFKRIAVTLDRYKLLPDTLPHTYVWVNLPSFNLQVVDNDSVVLTSRIIVGAPKTRTPLLTSEISNFITLPQWTVPFSIIFKEMLPQIQRNTDYLKKENLMVVDKNDNVVDPKKINWAKLNKNHFPYQIKQQQGDNNSLGVIKFNFRNKYSVYLHDTNVRWLFGKSFRALSHGCVRVKEWEKLSDFLVRNDTVKYSPDTLRAWIKRQEKHVVSGFQRVPVFLRYMGCDVKDGQLKFYDDIYDEDKFLREKYFSGKTVN